MKPGRLDRRVTLLAPSAGVDDGYTTTPGGWASAGVRWAQYIPGTAREVFEASGREAELPAIFVVRKDSVTSTITPTWRLTFETKTYHVLGVEEIGRREGIRIRAVADDS